MATLDKSEDLDEILQRDFTTVYRSGYITVHGVTMPNRFEEFQKRIYDWDVKEENVWICSFPKSGCTWTQEMVWMIMNDLDFVGGQVLLPKRSPFFEISSLFDFRQFKNENPDFKYPPSLDDSLKSVKVLNEKGPICLKTHLPWILLPKEIQNNTKKPKIIYLMRNPKDVCYSYYNHVVLLEGYKGGFENICRLFLGGKIPFAPYWSHVLPFWQRRDQPNLLILKYEDMIKDLPSIIRKVANFLEKPLSEEQIEVLGNHLSFSSMKNNVAVNYETFMKIRRKYNLTPNEGTFMRSGKIGSYKEKMSSEFIKKFDEWTEEHIKDTDFIF